jgi:hypothetical protein
MVLRRCALQKNTRSSGLEVLKGRILPYGELLSDIGLTSESIVLSVSFVRAVPPLKVERERLFPFVPWNSFIRTDSARAI